MSLFVVYLKTSSCRFSAWFLLYFICLTDASLSYPQVRFCLRFIHDIDLMEKSIVKYFAFHRKLYTFTDKELKCLSKAFLFYVAGDAVKETWARVLDELMF